jgi:hypothetical protein
MSGCATPEQAEIEANGYFTDPEWREVISPDGVRFLSAPSACLVTRFRAAAVTEQIRPPMPEDLSIPAFLRR